MISFFRSVSTALAKVSRQRAPISRLTFARPHFLAEYRAHNIGRSMENIILPNEDLLLDFVRQCSLQGNVVERVRVLSPGYMHDSIYWSLKI